MLADVLGVRMCMERMEWKRWGDGPRAGFGRYHGKIWKLNKNRVRFRHDNQRPDAFALNEVVHDVRSHVRRIQIQVKERMVVAHRHGTLHIERVLNRGTRSLFGC